MTNIDKNLLLTEPFEIDSKGFSVLALGAELKSSICLINNGKAFLSKTLDSLTNAENYREFVEIAGLFRSALPKEPDLIAYDMHPGYAASNYAKALNLPAIAVQHHFAHIVAAMIDNDIDEPVVGIAADGTGYGDDGAIWGCEILKCDRKSYTRAGHLKYFKLFGGDMASVETWRPAAGLMCETFGDDWDFDRVDKNDLQIAKTRIAKAELVKTSSLGRLFDAVAFLLNLCDKNEVEAQAPIALEQAASQSDSTDCFDYELTKDEQSCIELDFRKMVCSITADLKAGKDSNLLARMFHNTIAKMLADTAKQVSDENDIKKVVLSGGCFLNKILTEKIIELCRENSLEVFTHKNTPTGDGCIALGQAVVALENYIK